ECSWVIRIAEISRGLRPTDFSRLKVSRQEIPASTRMQAFELSTSEVFPRLPLASTETETLMLRSIHSSTVETGVTSWLSRYLRAKFSQSGSRIPRSNADIDMTLITDSRGRCPHMFGDST